MKKTLVLLIPVFLLILALPLGCGPSPVPETSDTGEAAATQQENQPGATATGPKDGKTEADRADVSLPADFPNDVPIPPKAKPTATNKTARMTSVTLETAEPVSEVVAFYQTALDARGWEVQASTGTANGAVIGATKQNRTLNVMVRKGPTDTIITLDLGQ